MSYNKNKKSLVGLLFSLVFIVILIGVAYLYLSPAFEQNKPVVEANKNIFWNLKSKVQIKIKDDTGIKYYKITFKDGSKNTVLAQKVIESPKKEMLIDIEPPKLDIFHKGEATQIEIEVVDNSKWNFLEGNKTIESIHVQLDTKKPVANVIANSRYIQRGGSGVVVVKVQDDNLEDAFITFNEKQNFKLIPFYKKDYYVALIAWPIEIEAFNRISLIATDKAGNKTITKVPFYIQGKKFKNDKIVLSEKFIRNVSVNVLEQSFEPIPVSLKDIFIYSNDVLRDKNIKTIKEIVLKSSSFEFFR